MISFPALVDALQRRGVRFVLIGVWGVNAHACDGASVFATNDFDLFLPPDPHNLLERLFLAAHADTLRQMLRDDEDR